MLLFKSFLNTYYPVVTAIRKYAVVILICLLPFIIFHGMLPFLTNIYPDNDLISIIFVFQAEYMFAMKTGTFPLNIAWHNIQNNQWAGMAGIFHPLSYIAMMLPGYANGYALAWNFSLHLILLAIAHLTLFRFFRKIQLKPSVAFFLSLVTVYASRIILSFTAAGATVVWTGYLLLFAAIGFYYLNPSGKKAPLAIIGLTYWIVSSGYAEETYFAFLGIALFLLLMPCFFAAIFPDRIITIPDLINFWGRTLIWCFIGIMLSAAFLLPFLVDDFQTINLSKQAYADACVFSTTVTDLIHNFFSPFSAGTNGIVGGSTSLLLLPLLLPILGVFRTPLPRTLWAIWALIIVVLLCMLGDATPVHYYIWKYIPFYSASRYANRISMLLPILFLLVLIWLFKNNNTRLRVFKKLKLSALSVLALSSLPLIVAYIFFISQQLGPASTLLSELNRKVVPLWPEWLWLISGVIALIAAAIHGSVDTKKLKSAAGIGLCVATCLQLVVFYRYAPISRMKMPVSEVRTFDQFLTQKRESINTFQGHYLFGIEKTLFPEYASLHLERYMQEPFLAKIYRQYTSVADQAEAYAVLNQNRQENLLVVEDYPEACRNGDNDRNGNNKLTPECRSQADQVRLVYSSYNRLVFEAQACQASFFMFSYNRTGHWQAQVNGASVRSYQANGHAHAVRIPAGCSTVEFRYWSWAAWCGMFISCATLSGICILCAVFVFRRPVGRVISLVAAVGACSLFFVWYHSLYTGKNLHTNYSWCSTPCHAPQNIAFGKPTNMSSPSFVYAFPLLHGSQYGVDGGRSLASCFSTSTQFFPWFEIDLLHSQEIGAIHIYASLQGKEADNLCWYTADSVAVNHNYDFFVLETIPVTFNLTPITIGVSDDRKNWQTTRIYSFVEDRPIILKPEKPLAGRYIRVTASGKCRLCLNEVEVYPPVGNKVK